jgi:DNA polymerase III subunit epsilon
MRHVPRAIKECFIDTETTGLNTNTAGIWQIGGIIRINNKVEEEFEFDCDIFEDDEVDPEALAMAGKTVVDFSTMSDPADVYTQLIAILEKYVDKYDKYDKMFFVGYGAEFDAKILRRWFEGFGDKYFGSWFWHPWICAMTLAGHHLRSVRHMMKDFRLETVAAELDVQVDQTKFHRALYDARITMFLYDTIIAQQKQEASPDLSGKESQKRPPKKIYHLDKRQRKYND